MGGGGGGGGGGGVGGEGGGGGIVTKTQSVLEIVLKPKMLEWWESSQMFKRYINFSENLSF